MLLVGLGGNVLHKKVHLLVEKVTTEGIDQRQGRRLVLGLQLVQDLQDKNDYYCIHRNHYPNTAHQPCSGPSGQYSMTALIGKNHTHLRHQPSPWSSSFGDGDIIQQLS